MIGEPPSDVGGDQLRVRVPPSMDDSRARPVGAPGATGSWTDDDAAMPVPTAFLAATVNRYVSPGVSPVQVWVPTRPRSTGVPPVRLSW